MALNKLYIMVSGLGWQIVNPPHPQAEGPADADAACLAPDEAHEYVDLEALRQALLEVSESKHTNACSIVIGVPSKWCLCATVSSEGLPRSSGPQREDALAYRLESLLPITAENCSIAFVGGAESNQRLGVAIEAQRLLPFVQALEDDGHEIEAIVPRGLLVAQANAHSPEFNRADKQLCMLWAEHTEPGLESLVQLATLQPDKSPHLRVISGHPGAIRDQLRMEQIASGVDTAWLIQEDRAEEWVPVIQAEYPAAEIHLLEDIEDAEYRTALSILDRKTQPWVNLRTGPLAPRHAWRRLRVPSAVCTAALFVLFMTMISLLWLRAWQHDQLAAQYDHEASVAFREVMPGQQVPTSPQRRLETKLRRLRGEQGLAAGEVSLSEQAPLLLLLQHALDGLPDDQRFTITDLRLEKDQLRITGQARTHGETDQIATQLRLNTPFIVDPPSTDQLPDGGVRFVIQAAYRPAVTQQATNSTADLLAKRGGGARP